MWIGFGLSVVAGAAALLTQGAISIVSVVLVVLVLATTITISLIQANKAGVLAAK